LLDLHSFFHPRSVAVVGASRTPGKAGHTVLANIIEFGFSGGLYPVNPGIDEVQGIRAYPSLGDLPEVPEVVVAVLPRERTEALMTECAALGVKNVIIPAAGFSDVGDEGRRLEEAVMAVAREAGMRVMGPNSIGTVCTTHGFATSIVTLDRMRPGSLSLFGQTGMFSSGIARWINTAEHFGVSKIACLGNKADIDENDLLEYLGSDDETRVIGMYTEGVRDGVRFASLLEEVASSKPVLLLKSGRTESGRRAIASHTGAMAGSEAIYAGLIEQAGAIRVADFEEMLDCAKAFDMQPLPRGNRVGIVSITGVGCVLSADAAGQFGLEFPPLSESTKEAVREGLPDWIPVTNPADIWAGIEAKGAGKAYGAGLRAVAADPSIDAVMAIFTLIPESQMDIVSLYESLREASPDKPIVAVLMAGDANMYSEWRNGLESAGFPTYPSPARCLRSLGAMSRFASNHARRA
jgi:acetate---CoA ligase (ADP-forming)